jgi:hypothetical protein
MNTEELKQIALAAAKNIKTEQDLAEFQQMLTKVTVEAAFVRRQNLLDRSDSSLREYPVHQLS